MDMNCKVSLLVFEWSHVKDIYSPYILSILGSHSQYLRPERIVSEGINIGILHQYRHYFASLII